MLRPEKAREELKKVAVKDGIARRVHALTELPKRLEVAGLALLGRDPGGKEIKDWDRCHQEGVRAVDILDSGPPCDREKVFAAFFPRLGAQIEAAWQLLHRVPYQLGDKRRAFRAPHTPAATRGRRRDWLDSLLQELQGYRADVVDVEWVAAWAAHLDTYESVAIGYLLGGVLDAGDSAAGRVFEILRASATGEHAIGRMGRHIPRAFLTAGRPEGWEFVEKLLLAAQRQEGLRQSILESIGEAHPEAFRRMLRLIRDHNLTRFSATVRAANVWLGMNWDVGSAKVVNRTLGRLLALFEDASARSEALRAGSAEETYFALWTLAFEDAVAAVGPAAVMLEDAAVERRFAAVTLLTQLRLPEARPPLIAALEDADLRIALTALEGMPLDHYEENEEEAVGECAQADDFFEKVESLLPRVPEKETLKPLIWPWTGRVAERKKVADGLVDCLGARPPARLLPHLPAMSSRGRFWVVLRLAEQKKWDEQTRAALLELAGDATHSVRIRALRALKKCKITPDEARRLEGRLTRKAGDLRRGVLDLLLAQKDPAVLESSDRLLAAATRTQRLGALDLLRQMAEANRAVKACQERARTYQAKHKQLSTEESENLDVLLNLDRKRPTLEDALGLMDPSKLTPVVPPRKRKVAFITPAAVACLKALDDLVHQYRETPCIVQTRDGPEERLLGNRGFPWPDRRNPVEEELKRLLLRDVWEGWYRDRPRSQRDRDGLELLRADLWQGVSEYEWEEWQEARDRSEGMRDALDTIAGGQEPVELRYEQAVGALLCWLLWLHPPENGVDYFLDGLESAFALVPRAELVRGADPDPDMPGLDWHELEAFNLWLAPLHDRFDFVARAPLTAEQEARLWHLLHWRDKPFPGARRVPVPLDVLFAAVDASAANEHDVLEELLGPRQLAPDCCRDFHTLVTLTAPRVPHALCLRPQLRDLVDRCRERILDVELSRGEAPTAASEPALALQSLTGLDTLLRLLTRLGKRSFDVSRDGISRATVLTHLVSVTLPAEADKPWPAAVRMRDAVTAGQVLRERLIELAFVSPRWTEHVERFLDWTGFAEGVWWFFAHMNHYHNRMRLLDDRSADEEDEEDAVGGENLSAWERLLHERTPLSAEDGDEGAVDVGWFRRTYAMLGPERWRILAEAAAYGCTRPTARKAFYLSQVLLGKARKRDIVTGVRKRRRRESVRLLGLLPLAGGERRGQDLISRYRILQEYRRYANSLGPMTKEGALRAAAIGLENLARTAGYPDPIRLEWSMGAQAAADLARGPVVQTVDGVTVTLALDSAAQPELTVRREEKVLASIPARLSKHPKIADLVERKADLKRQASRMRASLEAAMCRGDEFTAKEVLHLLEHPLLAPILPRLVLVCDGLLGYPDRDRQAMWHCSGRLRPFRESDRLRLAHPHDFLASREWDEWQHECFAAGRVQPFKQVFRELYVLTEPERTATVARRYQGQQINRSQGMALFAARGWRTRDEVSKTLYEVGVTATVEFRSHGGTPAQVEGPVVDGITFSRRGEWKAVPLAEVPPRLFSEVMRDLDLVVSVAHAGGVDPEATASTVEMRAALLRETCALLKLDNVRLQGSHVLIDGTLGNYSVHLGSAVVHRQPGGSLCIVPVPGQHRGRLFLPFADDDPRTAKLISKVLLLARDGAIQDPTILAQIHAKP